MKVKLIGLVIAGLLLCGCEVAIAGVIGKGEVRLALSDVSATTDWAGKEKNSTVYGITTKYMAKAQIRNAIYEFNANVDYSEQGFEGKDTVTTDNIRLRIERVQAWKKDIKSCISVKNLSHFQSDNYSRYYKVGLGKADGFILQKVTSSTMPLRVMYNIKGGLSYRQTNILDEKDSLGLLGEFDVIAIRGSWAIRVNDADIFVKGISDNAFEIPLQLEYCPKNVFIVYDLLIRGTNQKAGFLRTLRTGVKYQF